MAFYLVPRDVAATSAKVWVAGSSAEVEGRQVFVRASGADHPVTAWEQTRGVTHRLLVISGLSPHTTYRLELLVDGAPITTSSVTTLPRDLPRPGDKPFTIMLGSCFCRRQDRHGDVQRAYAALSPPEAPAVHVWAGDQVYLDSPWFRFPLPRTTNALEPIFRENYERTWSTGHGGGSLGAILASAANYFTSDDHEFWNNFPNRAAYVGNSLTAIGQAAWAPAATDFYRAFQTKPNVPELRIGNVSLRVVDIRVDRDADEKRFMKDPDLKQVCDWLGALTGPGFLVIGQPVFADQHGIRGHFLDWGLADYGQYATLVRALSAVEHSVVVLTGDVHYGRIARCTLRSGAKILEIISSPLALVDPKAKGTWEEAPRAFPSRPIPNVVSAIVETQPFKSVDPHFLTLELAARGTAVDLAVRYWPVGSSDRPRGEQVFRDQFH